MRHKIAGNKLNRKSAHRKATVRDIAKATLISQRIITTKAKAKEARKLVDKLITMGKKGTLAEKRRAFAILCDHKIVSDLFKTTAVRFNKRPGGYTRIIPFGTRRGDNADMAFLELTEKEEVIVSKATSSASTKKKDISVDASNDPKKQEKKKSNVDFSKVSEKQGSKSELSKSKPPKKTSTDKPKGKLGGLGQMFKRKTGTDS